jgi:hypothetical protein
MIMLDFAVSLANIFSVLVSIVVGWLILSGLFRWIFKIETQLNNQRATIWLLIKLLEKQGATPEEIQSLIKTFNIK